MVKHSVMPANANPTQLPQSISFLLRPVTKRLPIRSTKSIISSKSKVSKNIGKSLALTEFIQISARLPDSYEKVEKKTSMRKKEHERVITSANAAKTKGKIQTIDQAISKIIKEEDLGETKDEGITFFTFVLRHACRHFRFLKKKADDETRQFRIATLSFFELIDVATNTVSIVFYFLQPSTYLAGSILISFAIINRLVQGIMSCIYGESLWCNVQCFIGIKLISDEITISQKGPDHIEPNSSCEYTAAEMRALRGVCSLVCESFFHMIVHFVTFIVGVKGSGLLMMQVVSISSTVLMIGFLSAEFTYQMHVNLKKENEEIHPSMR